MSTCGDFARELMHAIRVFRCSIRETAGNPRVLLRRAQGQRQGVQAGLKFGVEQRVHGARTGDAGLAVEAV